MEVYGNTVWTFESQDDLREVYEAVCGREPLIDGAFDVHRIDGALALAMEPCASAFVYRSSVTLRAFPVDADDLNPAWREGETFEESRNFPLRRYGAYFEGKCVASLPLPAYPIADFESRWTPELLADGEAREKAQQARDAGRLLALFEGSCAAWVPLPEYTVASVRTGQYVSGESAIWSAEFAVAVRGA